MINILELKLVFDLELVIYFSFILTFKYTNLRKFHRTIEVMSINTNILISINYLFIKI